METVKITPPVQEIKSLQKITEQNLKQKNASITR
jgi:hypothetical protein